MSKFFELSWVESPNPRTSKEKELHTKQDDVIRSKLIEQLRSEVKSDDQRTNFINNILKSVQTYRIMKKGKQERISKTQLKDGFDDLIKATQYLKKASMLLCYKDEQDNVFPDINLMLMLNESQYKDQLIDMVSLLSCFGDDVCEDVKVARSKVGNGKGGGDAEFQKILVAEIKHIFDSRGISATLTKPKINRNGKSDPVLFYSVLEIVFNTLNISQSLFAAMNKCHEVSIQRTDGVIITSVKS